MFFQQVPFYVLIAIPNVYLVDNHSITLFLYDFSNDCFTLILIILYIIEVQRKIQKYIYDKQTPKALSGKVKTLPSLSELK